VKSYLDGGKLGRKSGEGFYSDYNEPLFTSVGESVAPPAISPGVIGWPPPLGLKIGQQREVKVAILCEGQVRPDAIHRYPNQFRAITLELWQQFLVQRQLVATDRAPISWVEG